MWPRFGQTRRNLGRMQQPRGARNPPTLAPNSARFGQQWRMSTTRGGGPIIALEHRLSNVAQSRTDAMSYEIYTSPRDVHLCVVRSQMCTLAEQCPRESSGDMTEVLDRRTMWMLIATVRALEELRADRGEATTVVQLDFLRAPTTSYGTRRCGAACVAVCRGTESLDPSVLGGRHMVVRGVDMAGGVPGEDTRGRSGAYRPVGSPRKVQLGGVR